MDQKVPSKDLYALIRKWRAAAKYAPALDDAADDLYAVILNNYDEG